MTRFFICLLVIGFSVGAMAQGSTGSTTGSTTKKKTTTSNQTTTGGSTTDGSGVSKEGWLTHNAKQYSIQYPSDWELDQSGQMFTSFILFSPLESSYDLFKENINLMVQNLALFGMSGKSLDQYVEMSLAQIPSVIENFYLISSTTKTNNGTTYQEVIYTGTQMNYELKWKQHIWLEGNKAYVLTFTAEQMKYDQYVKTCTAMMRTCKK